MNIDTLEQTIAVDDILLELERNPIDSEDYLSIERYYDALVKSNLISLIPASFLYDNKNFDYFFLLESEDKGKIKGFFHKLLVKSTMVEVILKYRLIDYLVFNHYHRKK